MKLNSKGSPCEASAEYHFASCLENSIIREVGCQPFWIERRIEPALPFCQKAAKFFEMMAKYDIVQELSLDELITDYKCPMPCAYMKYEVQYEFLFYFYRYHFEFSRLQDPY